jgi:hypothetical protein
MADMASGGKKKTTMAKLTRESKLRERRLDKQARKEARKHAPADPPADMPEGMTDESSEQGVPAAEQGAPAED